MNISTRCLTALALGGTLGLASCMDEQTGPMGPAPMETRASLNTSTSTSLVEEIYLSDELEDGGSLTIPEYNGGLLYQVELDGATSRANLTLIADLRATCAANLPAGVNCDVAFDKPHIGATADGGRIYVINRFRPSRPQDQPIYSGNPVGYYDRAYGDFVYHGQIQGLPNEGSILAANSPTNELYIANAQSNRLYRVDAATLAIEAEWPLVKSTGGTLDVVGADIAFDASGGLYLWTNTELNGGADRGLYSVSIPAGPGDAVATLRGTNSTSYFTGLAIREAGNGALIGSSETDDAIFEIDPSNGNVGTRFDMYLNGVRYDHRYGDMTTGLLSLPAPNLAITKTAGAASVAAGNPISFTIQVSSTGSATATNVTLTDPLPGGLGISWSVSPAVAGCSISGTSPQVLSCSFGSIAAGDSKSVTVTSATTAAACKQYDNTATVSATGVAAVSANASLTVTCPPPPTGFCSGGVTKLVLKYIGSTPLSGQVRGQRQNPQQSAILPAQTTGVGPNTLYTFAIQSLGGLFSPAANGRLANEFKVFIGNTLVGQIHTSCSQPIFPGMQIGGKFEIVEVYSRNGGQIGAP